MPTTGLMDDARVLDTLGVEMDVDLYTQTPAAAAAEIERLGPWTGSRGLPSGAGRPASIPAGPVHEGPLAAVIDTVKRLVHPRAHEHPAGGSGDGLLLASWRMNLDGGRLQDGEPHLAGTAKADVAYLSGATAARYGLIPGDLVTISGPDGWVSLPLAVTPMVDGVIWAPGRVGGRSTTAALGVGVGGRVAVSAREVSV
jgi:NADH-quinone oxidoreductase subunit G